jgi:hypothetical protein
MHIILIGKPEGKRPVGISRCRRLDVTETGGKLWTGYIWFRIVTSGGLL